MDHVCLALPVLPGKATDARTFLQQLDGSRRAEFDASERRIGITKELWYLASLPSGDHFGEPRQWPGLVATWRKPLPSARIT